MPKPTQPALRFTKESVRALTHSGKTDAKGKLARERYRDAKAEGLMLTVHPPKGDRRSRKTWTLRYRDPNGRDTEGRLGEFPGMDPDAARAAAAKYRLAVHEGRSGLVEERREAREKRLAAKRNSVDAVADAFLENACDHLRGKTKAKITQAIDNYVRPKWGKLPISELRRAAIVAYMNEIKTGKVQSPKERLTGGNGAAHTFLEVIRRILKYAVEVEVIDANPALGITPPKKNVRKQWAKDTEVKALWDRLEAHRQSRRAWCSATAIQLAFLTGKRRAEIAGITKSEVNFKERTWLIPGERTKNGKDDLVPLTDWTLGILEEAFERSGCEFAFLNKDRTEVMHPEAMTRIFARERLKSADEEGLKALETLHLHDSRRLVATTMAKLKVPPHVIGAILAHTPRGPAAATATYNVYEYEDEKREALEKWEKHLRGVIEPSANETEAEEVAAAA